jgi:hypothetical protein
MFGGAFPIPEGWPDWFSFTGACGLLHNDSDADGDPLTYELVAQPGHGEVVKIDDDWFAYKADPEYSTRAGDEAGGEWVSDSFTYRAHDGTSFSEPATMRFWLAPINDAPTFTRGGDVSVRGDAPYSAQWATDISAGPWEAQQAVHFEVFVDPTAAADLFSVPPSIDATGTLAFTPAPGKVGLAHVRVRAVDDGGLEDYSGVVEADLLEPPEDASDDVIFGIGVLPNIPPAAGDDAISVVQGAGPVSFALLANDTDPDGDALTIAATSQPAHGSVVVASNGLTLTYDPAGTYVGSDAFSYTVADGHGGSDGGAVTVTVNPDRAAPTVGKLARSLPGQVVGSSTVRLSLSWKGTDVGTGITSYRLERSVNGGSYAPFTLSSAAATSTTVTMSLGSSYRYRVRARDAAGNTGPYAYWATVTPRRYQESAANVQYTNTWSRAVDTNLSGGASRYTGSTSRRVAFTFTGREVAWVATRRTTGGTAQVRIDGVAIGTVDLDAAATGYRRLVFRRGFSSKGTHTIEIRPTGDGRVEADAFVVLE